MLGDQVLAIFMCHNGYLKLFYGHCVINRWCLCICVWHGVMMMREVINCSLELSWGGSTGRCEGVTPLFIISRHVY